MQNAASTMRVILPALALALCSALLSTVPATAESPVRLVRTDTGDRLELDARFGTSWRDVNIGRLVVRSAGRYETLEAGDADGQIGDKARRLALEHLPSADCALIIADLGPGYEKGRPDAWQRITHATKIVSCGGSQDALTSAQIERRRVAGGLLMAKTGSRAELQPLANPATLRPGADLPVRVYCDGQARAGVEVAAIRPDGSRSHLATDAVGAAILPVDSAGAWTFEADCGADRIGLGLPSLVASLRVDVLGTELWSRHEAGR